MKTREILLSEDEITAALDSLMVQAHSLARAKGWWDDAESSHVAVKAMLVVSEIVELVEEYRRHKEDDPSDKIPAITRGEEEWADVLIRLFDLGGALGFRPDAVLAKMQYNATRPLRHGGKAF